MLSLPQRDTLLPHRRGTPENKRCPSFTPHPPVLLDFVCRKYLIDVSTTVVALLIRNIHNKCTADNCAAKEIYMLSSLVDIPTSINATQPPARLSTDRESVSKTVGAPSSLLCDHASSTLGQEILRLLLFIMKQPTKRLGTSTIDSVCFQVSTFILDLACILAFFMWDRALEPSMGVRHAQSPPLPSPYPACSS